VGVWFHGVVSRQLHPVPAFDLAKGELYSVTLVAPLRKPSGIVLKKVEGVSIFYLQKYEADRLKKNKKLQYGSMYHFSTIGKTRKHNIDYSIQAF
jgi:hypothetical protein